MPGIDLLDLKTCTKCGDEKHSSSFSKRRGDGESLKSHCIECLREFDAKRRAANPRRAADWCKKNPEKVMARASEWKRKNPEYQAKYQAKYRVENPDAYRAWCAKNPLALRVYYENRRDREGVDGGRLSKGIAAKLFKLQKGRCPCCKQPLGDDFHLDHIIPLFLGGSNTDDNMQLLRAKCNLQKSAKHPIDFMQSRGFLL